MWRMHRPHAHKHTNECKSILFITPLIRALTELYASSNQPAEVGSDLPAGSQAAEAVKCANHGPASESIRAEGENSGWHVARRCIMLLPVTHRFLLCNRTMLGIELGCLAPRGS